MVWFSAATGCVASGSRAALKVRGPAWEAELTGALADELLRAFAGEGAPERLAALAAAGGEVHRGLLELARRGDVRPWVPLAIDRGEPVLFLEVVGQCNERCVHCYAESAPEITAALDRTTCERVIAEAGALGFEWLQLSGGDPLLCPFLADLVRLGRAAGFAGVEVYTNGLALGAARLEELAAAGARFAFSFYSHDPARHDARTRVPGSQRRTAEAISRAVRRGLPVRVGVVAFADDDDEHLARTRAFVEALGVAPAAVSVDGVHGVGRGRTVEAAPPTAGERGHGAGPATPAHPAPRWPGKLCVSYTGAVYPCVFARWLPLGDVRRDGLAAILERAAGGGAAGRLPVAEDRRLACLDCRLTALALAPGRAA